MATLAANWQAFLDARFFEHHKNIVLGFAMLNNHLP